MLAKCLVVFTLMLLPFSYIGFGIIAESADESTQHHSDEQRINNDKLGGAAAEDGHRVEKDSLGRVRLDGWVVNGQRSGQWLEFDEYGRLIGEAEYVADKVNGVMSEFYPGGPLFLRCKYRSGVREGKCTWYYPNGATLAVGTYKADVLDGPFFIYYIGGPVFASGAYVSGSVDGNWVQFSEDGHSQFFQRIKAGHDETMASDNGYSDAECLWSEIASQDTGGKRVRRILKEAHQPDNDDHALAAISLVYQGDRLVRISERGTFVNGKKQGAWVEAGGERLFPLATGGTAPPTWSFGKYDCGKKSGIWCSLTDDLHITQIVGYDVDEKISSIQIFRRNGTILASAESSDTLYRCTTWHESGQPQATGEMRDRDRVGLWIERDETGKVIRVERH